MEILYFIPGQVLIAEGFNLTQEIIVEVMPVDKVVMITDNADLADNLYFHA